MGSKALLSLRRLRQLFRFLEREGMPCVGRQELT
jgi:hypothetical protein